MNVLIVGGVAAGMSAAARLRRLNESARIIVFERGEFVSFANCGLPYHISGAIKDRRKLLLETPETLRASLNLDVRVRQEVTAIDRKNKSVRVFDHAANRAYEESYDHLLLAPGAQPFRPDLPGVDHPAVMTLRNIPDMDAIKARVDGGARRAVIIGGGYIGIEMAEALRERGLAVDLVEVFPQILPPLDAEMAWPVAEHLQKHDVSLHLGTAATAFHDQGKGVRVELQNGDTLDADFVLLSAGVRPDIALARDAGLKIGPRGGIAVNEFLQTSDDHIYAAGDAIETPHRALEGAWLIPLAGPANRQGRLVADNIMGRATPWKGAIGTSIVKAFHMTAGCTGANERTLQRAGAPHRKIYLHPGNHAGYYPAAHPLTFKLLFAPDTGLILGAQIVGVEGVDKRLDVIATAMAAKLTVFDLEELELAYAPPYGSAKDPVNMAGFIAGNTLRGDLALWYAEQVPDSAKAGVIVDVRDPSDFAAAHIPNAICIPLRELRSRMNELPKDKPIFAYCQVGFRSYLAARALAQHGYDARNLSGGFKTFLAWRAAHSRAHTAGEMK